MGNIKGCQGHFQTFPFQLEKQGMLIYNNLSREKVLLSMVLFCSLYFKPN